MATKTTTLRLDEETVRILEALRGAMGGLSASDVIRQALRDMAQARGIWEPKKVKR